MKTIGNILGLVIIGGLLYFANKNKEFDVLQNKKLKDYTGNDLALLVLLLTLIVGFIILLIRIF